MLGFLEDPSGKDHLWDIPTNLQIQQARGILDELGIGSRSIGKGRNGEARILIVDFAQQLKGNIDEFLLRTEHSAQPRSGNAAGIGEWSQVPDARGQGSKLYAKAIREYEAKYPERKHSRLPRRMSLGGYDGGEAITEHDEIGMKAWVLSLPPGGDDA